MGSLVVKLDKFTQDKLENKFYYSDIDMLTFRGPSRKVENPNNPESNGLDVYDVPMVYDVRAVQSAVRNILMWRVGESILRP